MRIPPYWKKSVYRGKNHQGKDCEFAAFGWSFISLEEAEVMGLERAKRIFEFIINNKNPEHYDYGERPIREEIIREIEVSGKNIATITRNRYGALVLNCQNVLFVDIDFPIPQPIGFLEAICMLFSSKKAADRKKEIIEQTVAKVEHWAANNSEHGFRIYLTKNGLRLLFTSRFYDPKSEETTAIMKSLGADKLYLKLTQNQECFRARMTAKPWRCGSGNPPNSFPWANQDSEDKYRRWEQNYNRLDSGFKICELIKEVGVVSDKEAIRLIIEIHDKGCRIDRDSPLA